jgi:hypothetical protein
MSYICRCLFSWCPRATPPAPVPGPAVQVIPPALPSNITPSSSSHSGQRYPQSITYHTSSVFSRCYGNDQLQRLPPPPLEQGSLVKEIPPSLVVQVTQAEDNRPSPQPSPPVFHLPEPSPTSLKVHSVFHGSSENKSPRHESSFLFPPNSCLQGPIPVALEPSNSLREPSHSSEAILLDPSHSPRGEKKTGIALSGRSTPEHNEKN